jgi:CRP-like cAMP-binding protein
MHYNGNMEQVRNRVLRMLPDVERARVLSVAECVTIQRRQVLHHYKLPIEHVYFVDQGLVSVAAKIGQEKFVEVWLIGSEGVVGAPVVLTENTDPLHRRTVQVSGQARRVSINAFRELLSELPTLSAILKRYLAVVLYQTSQTGACNSSHRLKQRLARWLLLARNSLDADEIPLTHQVLGQLLGVRRSSVTECLELLEREELISTRRGAIKIENVAELEGVCCQCFRLIEREFQRQMTRNPFATVSGPMFEPLGKPAPPSGGPLNYVAGS